MHAPDKPIVLIHGLIGSLSDPKILAAFGSTKIHAPDLIGYGRHSHTDTDNLTLGDQADHVIDFISSLGRGKVHLAGHSVGGAVSALVACRRPDLVETLTSIEGNFTLKDAFWSSQIAVKSDRKVVALIEDYRADPDAWIADAGVPRNDWTSTLARAWLANQPAATIKAQARAVVAATGQQSYLADMRTLMRSAMPVHLIAGARSAAGWDVPDWANQLCDMRINIPATGHLMMAEDPAAFANAILACLAYR